MLSAAAAAGPLLLAAAPEPVFSLLANSSQTSAPALTSMLTGAALAGAFRRASMGFTGWAFVMAASADMAWSIRFLHSAVWCPFPVKHFGQPATMPCFSSKAFVT